MHDMYCFGKNERGHYGPPKTTRPLWRGRPCCSIVDFPCVPTVVETSRRRIAAALLPLCPSDHVACVLTRSVFGRRRLRHSTPEEPRSSRSPPAASASPCRTDVQVHGTGPHVPGAVTDASGRAPPRRDGVRALLGVGAPHPPAPLPRAWFWPHTVKPGGQHVHPRWWRLHMDQSEQGHAAFEVMSHRGPQRFRFCAAAWVIDQLPNCLRPPILYDLACGPHHGEAPSRDPDDNQEPPSVR